MTTRDRAIQIGKYMTPNVHTIGSTIPIEAAWSRMQEFGIRHLPVLERGKLVGMVSERDLRYLVSFEGAQSLMVKDVMVPDPYVVTPETDLGEVASTMAAHRLGSAVVQGREGKVAGIFTFEDGLRALADVLGYAKGASAKKAA
jgi:acetoin utilization protein AcuB